MNTSQNATSDQSRPFGFWITAADRLLADRFATAFEDEGITRREWRILTVIGGTVPAGRELRGRALRTLSGLGWIERTVDGWALTADGAAAHARLGTAVEEIRTQVADLLAPEELAAMTASLEKLARGLGYEEGMRLPRRRGREPRGHRHGERFGQGEHPGHGHREHPARCGRAGHGRFAEHPGFGREWLRRGHHRGDHAPGMGPRGGRHRHAPAHLHIHLHDGQRNG